MRTRPTALAAATVLVALAGCGTDLAPDVHPGAAAVVGDTTITLDEVDDVAEDLCSVARPFNEGRGQAVALGVYRGIAVRSLADYELARQYAEAEGLEPGPAFRRSLDLVAQQLREDGAPSYATEVIVAHQERVRYPGAILAAAADPQQAADDFRTWSSGVDVDVDPRFGSVDLETGAYTPPTGLSARITEVDADSAGDLPAEQRCG